MPCYDVLVGAKTIEGNAHLAQKIGTVPAKRIPDLLAETSSGKAIKTLIAKYGDVSEALPNDYYYDWGSDEPFSLAGRGPGECGAGVMDVMKVDIDEAKDAVKAEQISNENVYKAIVAAARALLFTTGLEPRKDREILDAFKQHLIEPGWIEPKTQQLLDDALDWRIGDKNSIEDLAPQVRDLVNRVEELFLSLDANLKFKAEPAVQKISVETDKTKNHIIDLRGVVCPLNFVKAKLVLEKLEIGDILEVLLDEGEPVRNVPASFADQGQQVLEVKKVDGHYCVKVRRTK
jgi:sulfite reductase (ferredoxin)